jgi:hypothetical protein
MILRDGRRRTAHLHATWTEWKNTSLRTVGRVGNPGGWTRGSYGVERLSYYKMLPQMGPPETPSGISRGRTHHGTGNSVTSCEDAIAARRRLRLAGRCLGGMKIVQQVPRDR